MRSSAFPFFAIALVGCSPHDGPRGEALGSVRSALGWTVGANSPKGRSQHGAAALADGRVLIAGGFRSGEPAEVAAAEIYDPQANTWTPAGALSIGRMLPGAARLPSGKVVFAGGDQIGVGPSKVVDLYDPDTGLWTLGPALLAAQSRAVAHVLPSGKVLVVGGFATPEVFDEGAGTWTATGPVGVYRSTQLVTLGTGKVLMCGGLNESGQPRNSCTIYDPSTNIWTATGSLRQSRYHFLMAPLPGGGALAAGGDYGEPLATAERYDPTSGTWSSVAAMSVGRLQLGGGALPDGKVLAGFGGSKTSEVYDPATNTWALTGLGVYPRREVVSTTLPSGQIVFTGGWGPGYLATPEVYAQQAIGTACGGPGDCASGFCVDGVCCENACLGTCNACNVAGALGTCTALDGVAPSAGKSCAPYVRCVSGACPAACSTKDDCATDRYCAADGECRPMLALGGACTATNQCKSGFCVDGVCCGSACTAQCAACDVEGSFGTCTAIAGQPRGGRAPCTGVAVGTTCGNLCNGVDTAACSYPGTTVACGADGCVDGIEVRAGACDGAGLCKTTGASCGTFACAGTSCKTACSVAGDCAPGHYCASGSCVAIEGLGTACTSASTCKTGNCVDGVCCSVASCGEGATCASPKALGVCVKSAGSACSVDEQCSTGFCTDGVCCDARCDGQCEFCADAANKGVCQPALGKPRGTRAACETGLDVCQAKTCDGVERAACAGFQNGPDTVCGPAACKGDSLTREAKCDGSGACVAGASSSCLPHACAGRACATSCTRDDECAAEFRCAAGECVASSAKCSEDGLASIPTGGTARTCAPYRCQGGGDCASSCESSAQCAPDALCDATSKTCVSSAAPAADDGGGCSMSTPSGRGGSAFSFAWLIGALVAARRRARVAQALTAIGVTLGVAIGVTACSRHERAGGKTSIAPLRAHGPFAARLGDAEPIVASAGGFRIDKGLVRVFPATADGAWSLGSDAARLTVRALGVRTVSGTIVEKSVVFADAAEKTDLVLFQTNDLTEEVRVLRGPEAETTLRWELVTPLSLTIERGRVVARDAAGATVFATEEIDAIDAKGVRRLARVELEGSPPSRLVARFDLVGLSFPVVIDPAWRKGGEMASERSEHAAVRLADGRVLITGGSRASAALSSAEIYDPVTHESTAIASMNEVRTSHSLALLPDGTVLAGGGYTSTTELFDPKTGNWTSLGGSARRASALVALNDGRVLGVGTSNCSGTGSSIFDPGTKTWADGAAMNVARILPKALKLDDGRVFALGGDACGVYTYAPSAEVFDPTTNAWTSTPAPPAPHRNVSIAAVPGQRLLMIGGASNWAAAVYDGKTNAWVGTSNMLFQRWSQSAAALPNGRVLAFSGQMTSSAEVWDPATGGWSPAGNLSRIRMRVAVADLGGPLLITGGIAGVGTLGSTEIFTLVQDGGSCANAGECHSGFCVSGICCNTACGGTCDACDAAGSTGRCTAVDGDPHYGRSCGTAGLACEAGACRASCATDAHCLSTRFCDASGSCVARLPSGTACLRGPQCASGACVDGVCCDRACDGQCEACSEPGNVGKCVGAVGVPRGGRPACTGPAVGTTCGPRCDGKELTKCTDAPTTTFCSATSCSAGIETHASFCDGAGACKDVPKNCGSYTCDATLCKSSCASDGDCAAGHYCKGSACAKIEDLGTTCTVGATCKTGFCVGGVCCAAEACGPGLTCAAKGHEGTCTKRNGTACAASAECASGECIDGVCCDRACGGQCEACDVPGSLGTCVPAVGAPHGTRTACEGGGTPCAAKSCDGADGKSCAAFAPATTRCAPAACTGSTFSREARCDGNGACSAPETAACSPYACDDQGCLASCAGDSGCADGFECLKGACAPLRERCSEDLVESIAKDGTKTPCAPYRCGPTGACLTACATTSDCGGGYVCGEGKACVSLAAVTPEEGGGGCSTAREARTTVSGWAFALLTAAMVSRRRRGARPIG